MLGARDTIAAPLAGVRPTNSVLYHSLSVIVTDYQLGIISPTNEASYLLSQNSYLKNKHSNRRKVTENESG